MAAFRRGSAALRCGWVGRLLRRWWLLFGGGSRRRSGSGCALLCSLAVVGASGAALWLELPAVWRWFAQSTVDLLLLCVSVVGDMPAVDGEAGITKSKAKCALAFFPRAPLRHRKLLRSGLRSRTRGGGVTDHVTVEAVMAL